MPCPRHRERLRSVEVLEAGVDGRAGVRVVDRVGDVDQQAADLVDHLLHAVERRDQDVVDLDAGERLHRLDREVGTAG